MTFSFNFSAMAEELSLLGKAQKALNSKILVPIAAGIGTVYSGMLFKAAEEQEKEAEKMKKAAEKQAKALDKEQRKLEKEQKQFANASNPYNRNMTGSQKIVF